MAQRRRHGQPDDNYVYDERSVGLLGGGTHFSYERLYKSLTKRLSSMRQRLAPARVRLDERWIENSLVLRSLPPPPARILDVGGTTSPLPLTQAMLGYKVTVVDLRPYGFSHPNLRAVQGDVRNSPDLDPPYDVVSGISIIEHAGLARYGENPGISQPRDLLEAMGRLAADDGTLILTVPFGAAHIPNIGDRSSETGKPTGFRVFDHAALRTLVEGFRVEEEQTFGLREGAWKPMAAEEVEKVPLRRYATGMAFLRLRKS